MPSSILFVCTGNVYRSRFAEALFNHHASDRQLPWMAFSRGLATWKAPDIDLAPETREALETRGIPLHHTTEIRVSLTEGDLHRADHHVALSRGEHHPMVAEQFPAWIERFTFWEIEDVELWEADRAFREIEREVLGLLGDLPHPAEGKPVPE